MRVKSEARRQAILDVAAEIFCEQGFEQTSMSEITARVGGSKATLYSYFPSKEALFVEVMQRFGKAHIDGMFAELDPDQDLRESLCKFGEQFVAFLSQPKFIAVLRVVYAESGRSDIGRQFFERGPAEGNRRLASYFGQCMANGRLRKDNAQVCASHFTALLRAEIIDALLMDACGEGLPSVKESVGRAVEVFLRAYAAPV